MLRDDELVHSQQSTHDRFSLEAIVLGKGSLDERRRAAEMLFRDAHVRTHARLPIRRAAIAAIENPELLELICVEESEPTLRAIAMLKLGRNHEVCVCGICGVANLASTARCECGFDLASGDVTRTKAKCDSLRKRGALFYAAGPVLSSLALFGGTLHLPFFWTLSFRIQSFQVDLLLFIVGMALAFRGRKLREKPWSHWNGNIPTTG